MENLEKATNDMGIVLKLVSHVERPCTVKVNGITKNIREFYLREARNVLPTLENPYAKIFLERLIEKYS